jgi:hypothetical protein
LEESFAAWFAFGTIILRVDILRFVISFAAGCPDELL